MTACSFCSKTEENKEKIFSSQNNSVHICDRCIRSYYSMLFVSPETYTESNQYKKTAQSLQALRCSFCKRRFTQVQKLMASSGGFICDTCVIDARSFGFEKEATCGLCGILKAAKCIPPGEESFICQDCCNLCEQILAKELSKS